MSANVVAGGGGAPVQLGAKRNPDATVYVGELDPQVDEDLLWELFLQVGPVAYVHIPKDKVTGQHQGFGFVEFQTEADADYASRVMNHVRVYTKAIRVNKSSQKRGNATASMEVGANLFVGNLGPEVDERQLYEIFSRFGLVLTMPKLMRDPENGQSKGFAFVSFGDFESSDAAIAALNGQFLAGKAVSVSYAVKKDGKGERHGSEAERLLAKQKKAQQAQLQQQQQKLLPPQTVLPIPPVAAAPMPVFAAPPPAYGVPFQGMYPPQYAGVAPYYQYGMPQGMPQVMPQQMFYPPQQQQQMQHQVQPPQMNK